MSTLLEDVFSGEMASKWHNLQHLSVAGIVLCEPLAVKEDMSFLFHRESAVTGLYSFSCLPCYRSTKKIGFIKVAWIAYEITFLCLDLLVLLLSPHPLHLTSTLPPVPLGLFSSIWILNFNSAVSPLHSEQAYFGFKTSKEQLWAILHLCVKAIEFIL